MKIESKYIIGSKNRNIEQAAPTQWWSIMHISVFPLGGGVLRSLLASHVRRIILRLSECRVHT